MLCYDDEEKFSLACGTMRSFGKTVVRSGRRAAPADTRQATGGVDEQKG